MRIFLIALFAAPFVAISSQNSLLALEKNCNSPVWRNKEPCIGRNKKDKFYYGRWFPFGFDKKGEAISFAQLLSYKELNENSFRLISKFTYPNRGKTQGKLDINCDNKDYYIRPKGVMSQNSPWAKIPNGSGVETIARYFCKNSLAKASWGYTDGTKYIWDVALPKSGPEEVKGEWIPHSDGLGWYNTDVEILPKSVIYSYYSNYSGNYQWINSSCSANLSSIFYRPNQYVKGKWLGPKPAREKGTSLAVQDRYCK